MPPHVAVDTVHYKVFISGKSGVGKTALAARLAGLNLPSMHYETTGKSLLYTDRAGSFILLEVSSSKGASAQKNVSFVLQGIETTVVYWPVKLRESGKVLFFRFQLWDCGENALRRFDHLLPVCIKKIEHFHAETVKRIRMTLFEITVAPDVLSHSSLCLPVLSGAGGRCSFSLLLH